MCKLFPEENIEQDQNDKPSASKVEAINATQSFEAIMSQYNFSNQFIALLREMLKIDKNERIKTEELLQAFDLIVAN